MMTRKGGGEFVVLDFETSGMSPQQGDRAIEIGAVRVSDGKIVERFQSLMNPGFRINRFIEDFTGISNEMLRDAPDGGKVMEDFAGFIGNAPLVAHNASFDRRFLDAELRRIKRSLLQEFGCSLLVARRVYPEAPNHKLETLVRYRQLPSKGQFHRALADAEMTCHLWLGMASDLKKSYGFKEVSFKLMQGLAGVPKAKAASYLAKKAQGKS